MALAAVNCPLRGKEEFLQYLRKTAELLASTRPTAVNLFWALQRMLNVIERAGALDVSELKALIIQEAHNIFIEDVAMNKRIGNYGNELIPAGARILTHCNAGALATAGYGTALGVIRAAHDAGKEISVFADETRPLLQGARLTAWELMQDGIPVTLITDNMAGYLMKKGMIDLAIVGADRITANGDVANKIGTYTVAVLCKEHNIPFYVAAPASTVDMSLATGDDITIEERHPEEVTAVFGQEVAPKGVKVLNPAFDVTPNEIITAIITDRGVIKPPFIDNMKRLF
jgi:methylthioribose-1-phosphate isomerase